MASSQGRSWLDVCTVPAGRVAGIPVRLHLLLVVVLALGVVGQIGRPPLYFVWAAVLYGPILFATVLVHELG